jgi:hypothetical protein
VCNDDNLIDRLVNALCGATVSRFSTWQGAEKKARCDDHSGHGEKTWSSRHGPQLPFVARFIWLSACQKLCRKL